MKLIENFPTEIVPFGPTCAGARNIFISMADLKNRITASDLPRNQKRTLNRAIDTACMWFGLQPATLLAHPTNIAPRFRRLSPGGLGISKKRISNVKSEVRAAFVWAGLIGQPSYLLPR